MSMTGYTKLFSSIVTSTVWREPDHVRLVWITLLALSNRDGIAEASIPGLADMAKVTLEDCEDAIKRLAGPDKYSRTKDFEGRRIRECDGGWQLINHEKYRAKMSADERREYNRVKQAESRARAASLIVNDISRSSALSAHTDTDTKAETETKKIKTPRRASRSSADEPKDFVDFWSLYPNHKGRKTALRAWIKLNPSQSLVAEMVTARDGQKKDPQWTKDSGQFVPMLSTWLNGRRWEDEPSKVTRQKSLGPVYADVKDWQDECRELHQGRCGNAFFHAAKREQES